MLCYYIIFDQNLSEKLLQNYSQNIIPNPTKTKFENKSKNVYKLDSTSDFCVVFVAIKWQDSNRLEKFLNKEKAVYDILGDVQLPKTKLKIRKLDIFLIFILVATLGICFYYRDILMPQVREIYRFIRSFINSKA